MSTARRSPQVLNLLTELPVPGSKESIDKLAESAGVVIERIVSHGHTAPESGWFDQDRDEWVIVLRGAAKLELEGDPPVDLRPGDSLLIPGRTRHRVCWTTPDEPTVWLAVHLPDETEHSEEEPGR